MPRILVTGALGQIGSELVPALAKRYGAENVIASDIKPHNSSFYDCKFEQLDILNAHQIATIVQRHKINTIYHLAALLSAVGEAKPQEAWKINVNGLYNILEVAREFNCAVFVPSSIAAFGPTTPKNKTPQDTIQRPVTIYGISKVTGELLCDYYHLKYGLDIRGLRYPGLISYVTPPGGGTTDWAVHIYYEALLHHQYACFLAPGTFLDMMYMPDAIRAAIELMEADPSRLKHRNAFNITAINVDPEIVAAAIRKHIPDFKLTYEIDPVRQAIAESWPKSLDDTAAREEWGWQPKYDLDTMTEDILYHLKIKLNISE